MEKQTKTVKRSIYVAWIDVPKWSIDMNEKRGLGRWVRLWLPKNYDIKVEHRREGSMVSIAEFSNIVFLTVNMKLWRVVVDKKKMEGVTNAMPT